MRKDIGQPSPLPPQPKLLLPNCVQTESHQQQLSQRPQFASSCPLLGGPSKAGKGLTSSVVQVVCFTCSRNSKLLVEVKFTLHALQCPATQEGKATQPAVAGRLAITALVASRLEYIMVTWTFATPSLLCLSLHNTPPSK